MNDKPKKGEALIFFFVLFIVIFVIFYIGIKLNKKAAQPEGIITEPSLQKKTILIQDVALNTDFLQTEKFQALKSSIELPIQAGEIGKSELF